MRLMPVTLIDLLLVELSENPHLRQLVGDKEAKDRKSLEERLIGICAQCDLTDKMKAVIASKNRTLIHPASVELIKMGGLSPIGLIAMLFARGLCERKRGFTAPLSVYPTKGPAKGQVLSLYWEREAGFIGVVGTLGFDAIGEIIWNDYEATISTHGRRNIPESIIHSARGMPIAQLIPHPVFEVVPMKISHIRKNNITLKNHQHLIVQDMI